MYTIRLKQLQQSDTIEFSEGIVHIMVPNKFIPKVYETVQKTIVFFIMPSVCNMAEDSA